MGKFTPLNSPIIQILIAILIPNIGGILMYVLLWEKLREHESKEQLEPIYAPPGWVSIFYI